MAADYQALSLLLGGILALAALRVVVCAWLERDSLGRGGPTAGRARARRRGQAMSRPSRAEREAEQLAHYGEACAWWARLQERRPRDRWMSPQLGEWIAATGAAYNRVTVMARRTGMPDLSAWDTRSGGPG